MKNRRRDSFCVGVCLVAVAHALNAQSSQAGDPIRASPISFSVDGRQHGAVAAGRAFIVFALPGS